MSIKEDLKIAVEKQCAGNRDLPLENNFAAACEGVAVKLLDDDSRPAEVLALLAIYNELICIRQAIAVGK